MVDNCYLDHTDFYFADTEIWKDHPSNPRRWEVFVLLNGEFVSGCIEADVYSEKVIRIKNDLSKGIYNTLVTDYGTFNTNYLSTDLGEDNENFVTEEVFGDVQILFINQECKDRWLSRKDGYYTKEIEDGQGTQSG